MKTKKPVDLEKQGFDATGMTEEECLTVKRKSAKEIRVLRVRTRNPDNRIVKQESLTLPVWVNLDGTIFVKSADRLPVYIKEDTLDLFLEEDMPFAGCINEYRNEMDPCYAETD